MIARLTGRIVDTSFDKDTSRVVIDVNGVGYEVLLTRASETRIREGQTMTLYVKESVTAYDGATTLYGFISTEEQELFVQLRDNVDGMSPKKALESMDKIAKSMPDFKRAIIEADGRMLVSVFGFTKKTAEKLIFSLKNRVDNWTVSGSEKWTEALRSSSEVDAVSGLVNLGYSEIEARDAVGQAKEKLGEAAKTEQLLQFALKLNGAKIG